MANPLASVSTQSRPQTDWLAWCRRENQDPLFVRMNRWFYVTEQDGRQIVAKLEGTDGENLRKQLAGKLDDFVGWPASRMNGYRSWLMKCARAGGWEMPMLHHEPNQ